jgi:hypothetical protein
MKTVLVLLSFLYAVTSAQEIGARYLIITDPIYYDQVLPLAQWKMQKGLKTKVVTTTETGPAKEQIRAYVAQAYTSWQIKPEYLLLVGSNQNIAFPQYLIHSYVVYSDNYYTDVVGDFHNEILPGRLWVYDTIEAKTVIAKVLGYEKNPFLDDSLWFKKGVTIVNEYEPGQPSSESLYWADARYAHELMTNAGFVHIDSFAYSLGDDSLDVVDAINDGRSYILFRGIGYGRWEQPFWGIYPYQMYNGFKLPIVISATCGTIDGIGHEWLRAGTPEEPKGVVGFFGTTTALFEAAEERSALARGTLESIFCDSLTTLGKATEAGRIRYYNLFNDTLDYDGWNCLGDPEMTLWTSTPKQIQVTHSPESWQGGSLTVYVTHNAQPVESALVCVMAKDDSSVYHYGRTDNGGMILFEDSLHFPDSAWITVTGRNLLPQTDTVIGVYKGGPYVIHKQHAVLDTISGNGNYQANNGEDIELMVWVTNFGDSTAYDVYGVLQKDELDDYYYLSDTVKYFGDIKPDDSANTSDDGFNLIIDPNCPDSHTIHLKLKTRDYHDSIWESNINVLVYSPRPFLVYSSHLVIDTVGGNGNFQVNPGENIEIPVWIKNVGDSLAEDVYGTLQKSTSDPNFTLNDTVKYFGTILPMDSAWTTANGYNVMTDPSCPDSHEIALRLRIVDSLDSVWIYDFNLINHAPLLTFHAYFIHDTMKYITHGDTAPLAVYIENNGSFTAANTMGTLMSNDSFLTIIDGYAHFGTIEPESIGSNQSNPFSLVAHPEAPYGYSTTVYLALDAGVYHDTLEFEIYIGQKDYVVWDPDPNHSSGFIIHTRLSACGYNGDYRQTLPSGYLTLYKALFTSFFMYP